MRIGGMFVPESIGEMRNDIPDGLLFCMSGRCALYACLADMGCTANSVAYVPSYTCETVLSAYCKAGYRLRFYDVDPEGLKPRFRIEDLEGVSVLSLCGYYGFSTYDETFVRLCHERGIIILHDTTHTPFAPDPLADYWAGSFRKWMGIACGGVAHKASGKFNIMLLEPDTEHLQGRYLAMEERKQALETHDASFDEKAGQTFWTTELRLRNMFGMFGSDQQSEDVLTHYDFVSMIKKRRENFRTIASNVSRQLGWKPVFQYLDERAVPSHYALYAEDRDKMSAYLSGQGIKSTVYWPIPPMINDISRYPGTQWIDHHILSVPLDQRYSRSDMEFLASVLDAYGA